MTCRVLRFTRKNSFFHDASFIMKIIWKRAAFYLHGPPFVKIDGRRLTYLESLRLLMGFSLRLSQVKENSYFETQDLKSGTLHSENLGSLHPQSWPLILYPYVRASTKHYCLSKILFWSTGKLTSGKHHREEPQKLLAKYTRSWRFKTRRFLDRAVFFHRNSSLSFIKNWYWA